MEKDFVMELINQKTEEIQPKLIEIRRDIYTNPELSGKEKRTAALVAAHLRGLGMDVQENVGGYGVVGILKGGLEGEGVVALRADMDALPIQDVISRPYSSKIPGVKHGCGHDVHTTIGMGVAEVLASLKEQIQGTIKFIFQPAEENLEGALAMIKDGVLTNSRPDAIFGHHVVPIPVGTYGWGEFVLGGLDRYEIKIFSQEEGAAQPDLEALVRECVTAILSLNTLPGFPSTSEELQKFFTDIVEGAPEYRKFIAFHAKSMKPGDEAAVHRFDFGYKTKPDALRTEAYAKCIEAIERILSPQHVRYEVKHVFSLPATINDSELLKWSLPIIETVIGKDRMIEFLATSPGSGEDFSYFQKEIPGVFFWLGAANLEKGITAMPHSPDFDVDEACLGVGTKIMASLLLNYLNSH
jgi:metal-dependent amidase/aminoacylase/carboxypeptidase family protein